jgi:outer membrane receptor for ferrienterochelin and colicins
MRYAYGRLSLLLSVILVVAAPAAAQSGTVTGTVTSIETAAPLQGARVELLTPAGESLTGTLSDAQGRFRLANVAAGTYVLNVQMIGYEAQRIDALAVAAGAVVDLVVQLRSRAVELNPIVVSASRRVERALDAPARVEVIAEQEIDARPAVSFVDHVRAVPGVDIATHGVQSANVTTRGFNNVFSGAMFMLTDHRLAGVPSLRVNLMHLIPSNNEDIERVEVVLGPGAALYGPNTAHGVMHMFTKSPLSGPETTISLSGGEQSVFHGSFRTAQRFGEDFGVKLSGEYFRGEEWRYNDPTELAERGRADQNPAAWKAPWVLAGVPEQEVDLRFARMGSRDFDIERWAGELRADWRITPDLTTVLSVGRTTSMNALELTGLGVAQAVDWGYTYYQARATWNRLFGQLYLNASDAGDSYTIRDGAPVIDRSRMLVGQLQHGADLGERQRFTYGVDYFHTMPETDGTIHGRYEDDDETVEVGGYIQSETSLHPQLDLVLAGRLDHNSNLPDVVFSPRAALVFRPLENQTLRLTFNRAFSTPRSLDLFLDRHAGPFPEERLGQLFGARAQGPGRDGFSLFRADGSPGMRSPFTPAALGGPEQVLPADVSIMWNFLVGVLQAQGALDQQQAQFLMQNAPTSDAQVARLAWNFWQAGPPVPLAQYQATEVSPLRHSSTQTFEIGYRGILGDRLLLAADVWHSTRDNLISALFPVTPLLLLNPSQIEQHLISLGFPEPQAGALAEGMGGIPVGILASEEISTAPGRPDIVLTYRNFGRVNLWGSDISARFLVTNEFSLGAMASFVNRDHFLTEGQIVPLNAPTTKLGFTAGYRSEALGLNGEGRVRYNNSFPVLSAPFFATQCLPTELRAGITGLEEPCVEDHAIMDLTLGYQLPGLQGTSLQLAVQNLFDRGYRSFPGVPEIGRMALLRLRYEF